MSRKPCSICGGPKPPGRGRVWCDDCSIHCEDHEVFQGGSCGACDSLYRIRMRELKPGSAKRAVKKSKYRLTDEQYDALEAIEACEICGSSDRLVIDHNHDTMKVRGKICHGCNVAIGMARESIATLEGIINYLKERN